MNLEPRPLPPKLYKELTRFCYKTRSKRGQDYATKKMERLVKIGNTIERPYIILILKEEDRKKLLSDCSQELREYINVFICYCK